jgi:transcriptional regulator with XRE-family HTH domain
LREVGTTLRRKRTQRGLSLERLSAASGVSRSMLSRVERGESEPTIFTLVHIARALNVELAAILPPSILKPNTPAPAASPFERK